MLAVPSTPLDRTLAAVPRPDPAWFLRPDGTDGSPGIHGVGHTVRVLVHAVEIAEALGAVGWERDSVVLAALWHDIGRTDDGADYYHGAKSAGKAVGLGLHRGVDARVLETALHAVTHHSGSEPHGERAARWLPEPDAALRVFRILKDADGLDRVRLGDLDPSYLRLEPSRRRVERASQLLRLFPAR
jgi:HD superfamily phosphodiesterase